MCHLFALRRSTERLNLQSYTATFPDDFPERVLQVRDLDANFLLSLPTGSGSNVRRLVFLTRRIRVAKKLPDIKVGGRSCFSLVSYFVRNSAMNSSEKSPRIIA